MTDLNNKFLNYMKSAPKIYEESSSAFWDDRHISKYMLEAHLNPDIDSASRKHDFILQSVNWIDQLVGGSNGKRLLDLGCGPGLYAELLADKGFNVTGIDFSERSINYAKSQAKKNSKNIEYIYQNYLEMDYVDTFDVIILIYCDFGVLSFDERERLLQKIQRALRKDGILIMDGFTENYLKEFEEKQIINYTNSGFWSENPHVVIQRNCIYHDTLNTLEQFIIVTEDNCDCYNIWNQIYSKESMEDEIKKSGFHQIRFYDNVKGTEYTGDNETICIVASK